jgi:hypothetical protein
MKLTSFFSSLIHLFTFLILLGFALFFISLRWLDWLSFRLAETFLYRPESFTSLGLFFLALAFFLLIVCYSIFRYKPISILAKPFSCEVDPSIIKKYAEKYFEGLFEVDIIGTEVSVSRNKLEIIAYLPSSKVKDAFPLLKRASVDFSNLLREKFSYKKKVLVTFKYL